MNTHHIIWQKSIIDTCEQSAKSIVPRLEMNKVSQATIIIEPEDGLSDQEIANAIVIGWLMRLRLSEWVLIR